MNWGNWIVVSFVLFALFIATLVTVCVRQDVSLVTRDYYREELAYQDQIDRINNALELDTRPSVSWVQNKIKVSFEEFSRIESGRLVLFCPSDPEYDRTFPLSPSSVSVQVFDPGQTKSGMYRARIQWKMDGREFYTEEVIYQ